jgi:hypothetical protein
MASNYHIDFGYGNVGQLGAYGSNTDVGELRFNRSRYSAPQLILVADTSRFGVVHRVGRRCSIRNRMASLGYYPSRCLSGLRVAAVGAHCNNANSPRMRIADD